MRWWEIGLHMAVALFLVICAAPPSSGSDVVLVEDPWETDWSYHDSYGISLRTEVLASERPDLARYTTAQELLGVRDVPGDRTIPILMAGDFTDRGRPHLMFIGAHHGNEPDSAEGVLAAAYYILTGRTERTESILASTNLVFLPVVNPYGLDMGTRSDENGEDPNRDYPFSPSPASTDSDGRPLTTAGAKTVHELASSYPFSIALSFHTGSWGIFTPWGAKDISPTTPDHNSFMDLARNLSRASAQGMPFGPANDFSGLSYLNGAFDDHLYGSTVMPERLFSQDLMLPVSTAAFTVELHTGSGRDPEGLGSLEEVDGDGYTVNSVPTAVRICVAACMMAAPSIDHTIEVDHDGAALELTVRGTDIPEVVEIMGVLENGSETEATIGDVEVDPFFPMTRIEAELPGSMTYAYALGRPGRDWDLPPEDPQPRTSPRSVFALRGSREIYHPIPVTVDSTGSMLDLLGPSGPVIAGQPMEILLDIDTGFDVAVLGLDLILDSETASMVTFGPEDLVLGRNALTIPGPLNDGGHLLEAVLRTGPGDVRDAIRVHSDPGLSVWAFAVGKEAKVQIASVGADSPVDVIYSFNPTGPGSSQGLGPFVVRVEPGQTLVIDVDLTPLYGNHSLMAWIPPMDPVRFHIFSVEPTLTGSGLPARMENGTLVLGPFTAYSGHLPLDDEGPWGENSVTASLISDDGGTLQVRMSFVPWEGLGALERMMAYDQAIVVGADPGLLAGAFMAWVPLPEDGAYTISCLLTNDMGVVRSGEGTGSWSPPGTMYGSIVVEREDEEEGFPYLVVILFALLSAFMLFVTYLRYPARMRAMTAGRQGHDGPDRRNVGRRVEDHVRTGRR